MADENLTKTVAELLKENFYIPAYQRGYRWTEYEVKALLDDIYEFDAGTKENPLRYCLQPLIVQKDQEGRYEVVDGQQRLTTIYIFLKIFYKYKQETKHDTEQKLYTLEYATRLGSQNFLKDLSKYDGIVDKKNIDYYHITKAYNTIIKWIDDKVEQGPETDKESFKDKMYNKIVDNTFFIWYEVPENENAVELFNRVNVGKISLSNAELIKALLFNKNNFNESNEMYADRVQQELALSWDRIERGLQNESFWCFINEPDTYETRIDFLFYLLSDSYKPKDEDKQKKPSQENELFLIYYAAYKPAENKSEFVFDLWKKIEGLYERFQEWYADLNKYHVIGFLIASGVSIKEIFKLTDGKRKSEMLSDLINKAKDKVHIDSKETLENKSYAENKSELRQLFLLFNIATLYRKDKKQQEQQYRFPFDLYKKEKWDIEHIHAKNDQSNTQDDQSNTQNNEYVEPDDSIGNLTLLNAEINRSYKDSEFKVKRIVIRDRDSKGIFIPICTKNVFQKQYTEEINSMDEWEDKDKDAYVDAIWETLSSFWGGSNE